MLCPPLRLLAFVGACLLVPSARAHLPLETSVRIVATAEALELAATVAEPTARSLLTPAPITPIQADNFPDHRPALLAAAASVITLLDSSDTPIPPLQTLVTLNAEGEVTYLFLYPPDTRPAALRSDFLDTRPSLGRFVAVADGTRTPAGRAVLVRGHFTYRFSAPDPAPASP